MRARWDLFCRVVDNFGDIGVCWRLAADLAARGHEVRLFADDLSALAWMAPDGAPGVTVQPWPQVATALPPDPGDVVIEAFGCDPPPGFVERMAAAPVPPVWINLEYLSAEAVAVRNHGLPSPQHAGPGRGLVKWFYYPGFTPDSGGLIREPDLLQRQQRFARGAWRARLGLGEHERAVVLFCYDNPALPALLDRLSGEPTRLLVPPGPAAAAVRRALGPGLSRGPVSATLLPHLAQRAFDELLWGADLNLVRGEDSFVRAQWAGRPFVWQIYPQSDGAHAAKLEAFLERLDAPPAPPHAAAALRALHRGWNGLAELPPALPAAAPWDTLVTGWRERLLAQADLTTRLVTFAQTHRNSGKS